jgi:hypothetical protein
MKFEVTRLLGGLVFVYVAVMFVLHGLGTLERVVAKPVDGSIAAQPAFVEFQLPVLGKDDVVWSL